MIKIVKYNLGRVKGTDGISITDINKTNTSGLVDTYTITLSNDDTHTFTVTNGRDGVNDIVTSWESTLSDTKVPSEKLVKNTLDTKINTSDIVDNLTTNDNTKVLSAKQGKQLADMIGEAIQYINL